MNSLGLPADLDSSNESQTDAEFDHVEPKHLRTETSDDDVPAF